MSSKRIKKLPENTSTLKANIFENVVTEVKKNCTTKFEESIDQNLQINHKQKKSEINLRTVVNLPVFFGKKIKVAVVCEEGKFKDVKEVGADIIGGDDFIEKIKNGDLNFDKLISTTSMMIKLSKLGKILGTKGLMANFKFGSVTDNIKKVVTDEKSGQVEIKNDKDGNIGLSIGKKFFSDDKFMKKL
jgi:Ribosomal protein L1